jgi:hypothetical protein
VANARAAGLRGGLQWSRPNQKGTATLSGGNWLVTDASFCGLLNLQPTAATKAVCG